MLTVHHLNNSRSQRLLWLLEELGVPYEIVRYQRQPDMRAPALLRPLVRKVSNQALTTLVNPQLKQHMAFWESELGKSQWFAGNQFTAADIQMSFPLEAAAARGGLEQGHPRAMAFLERIHARPAYNRALEKGGPFTVGR